MLHRFDLQRIVKDYKIDFLFESGTFRGDALAYALSAPFTKMISVEIVPELADAARKRFELEPRIEILTNDSLSALENVLPALKGNGIFWLDAHFPGADAGLTAYDDCNEEELRLPLMKELEIIKRLRPQNRDVMILDDLRIYEDGPYDNGNVPEDAKPSGDRSLQFVYDLFGKTHIILKSYKDEGYTLLFPRSVYRRLHFRISQWFGAGIPEDFYYR